MVSLPLIEKAQHFLFGRQKAYQTIFSGPVAEKVLTDLAQFCRANQSTFHPDPRVHALMEGRREVWLRIQNHLKLTPEQLWQLQNEGK